MSNIASSESLAAAIEHAAGRLIRQHVLDGGTLPLDHAWCVRCVCPEQTLERLLYAIPAGRVDTVRVGATDRSEDPDLFGVILAGELEFWFPLDAGIVRN